MNPNSLITDLTQALVGLLRATARLFPLILFFTTIGSAHGDISEPATIFYGQIINRTSGQVDLLTQGSLVWTIGIPGGTQVTVTNSLQPLDGGAYSYEIQVPHEAQAFGLLISSNSLPLPPAPVDYTHLQILVNGSPATILPPASGQFSVSQGLRAATYRVDLEVTNQLISSSGDGIPDWWAALYGVTDPNADPMGDGWSNLQKFLNGGNPNADNRIPTLATTEIWAYADGLTGVRLQAVDSDSGPTNLFYTLTAPPTGGTLFLLNASINGTNSNTALAPGAAFTQDDVNHGRLVFLQQDTNNPVLPTSFTVNLHDENPGHPSTNASVRVNVYRPLYPMAVLKQAEAMALAPASAAPLSGLGPDEEQMLLNYFRARDLGFVIWDVSRAAASQLVQVASSGLTSNQYTQYTAAYGRDHHYVLVGGAGNDRLVGGMENDVLVAGRGTDTLRGNGGANLFIIPGTNAGNDTIEDFNITNQDVLDISRLLVGSSGYVTNYVQITNSGTNCYLSINFAGMGTGFTNMVITLWGTHFSETDLRSLVEGGSLLTGSKVFAPQISLVASQPAASQNGPVPGIFTLTRSGPTDSALSVNLQITGSAVNGSDYQYISSVASFAPGQSSLALAINPFANASTVTQIVQVAVAPGTGYELGNTSLAQITIEPLAPQISIQAIEPVAAQNNQMPGTFLITRAGVLDRSVLVRLTVSGSAPTSHYQNISPFVNLGPEVTTALINIVPSSNSVISNGLEYVQLTIKPDPSYKVMTPSSDVVLLVPQMLTGAEWEQQNFPTATNTWTSFAGLDTGGTGVRNIFRYAFGLDPQNPNGSTGMPKGGVQNGHLMLSFREPATVSDIDYVVEVSDDMTTWSSADTDVQQFYPAIGATNLQMVYFQGTAPVSSKSHQFMRVRLVPQ